MWKRIADGLLLTKTERKVILFLSVTMAIGAGIRLYQASVPVASRFEYRLSDSAFAAASTVPEDSLTAKSEDEPADTAGAININTATHQQLMKLPGIGTVTAARIISARSELGQFKTIEDLRTIKGISQKKLKKLAPMITVH
jgi:competence ComEA-like helix-hairpin-helix protein